MKLDEWIRRPLQRALKLAPSDYDKPFADNIVREASGKSSMLMGYRDTADGRYRGTVRTYFTRLNLSTLFLNNPPSIEAYGIDNIHDLLPIVEEKYGLYIPKSDIQNFIFDKWSLPRTITIQTATNSALYEGSVDLQVNVKQMALDEVITVLDLDGIVDRFPRSESKMRYELRYYGFDFTDYKEIIGKYPAGFVYNSSASDFLAMLNSVEVRGEMDSPTFAPFYAGGPPVAHTYYLMKCVFRGLTTAVPDANQAYKYVAVWTASQSAAGIGRLLLHYD